MQTLLTKRNSRGSVLEDYIRHESRTSMRPQDIRSSTTKKSSLPNNRNSINTVDSETDSENDLKAPAEDDDKRKSLRASLAGVEVTNRLVNKFGSVKAIIDENERMERAGLFVIHPYSNFRLMWDMFTFVMLALNIILIPIFMAFPIFEFTNDKPVNDQSQAMAALVIRLLSDAWFTIDIAINFRTGIVVEGSNSEVVIDAREIRRKYLRGWFFLDLISTVPFDIAIQFFSVMLVDGGHSQQAEKSTMMFRYLRLTKGFQLLKLLRVSRIWRYMHQWDEMFNLPFDSALVLLRMMGAFCSLLLYAHLSACVQFMVPMVMGYPDNCWVRLRGLHLPDTLFGRQYGWSFFRAVSQMLCIGYGQFPPQTKAEMYTTMSLMLVGAITFAVFIGIATSIVQSHNASKRLYAEKYASVKHYMIFRKIPTDLRRRISDYYENRFQGKMFNEAQILTDLNPILREAIVNHNCRELVDSVPFFSRADPEFVASLVRRLKFEMYLYNDEIIREGTVGKKMYFISRGTVRIVNSKAKSHLLSDGAFFGEISLLLPQLRRVASVFADSYCYLYSLTVDDFNDVLEDFPVQRKAFIAEAGKRLDNMKEAKDDDDTVSKSSKMNLWKKQRVSTMKKTPQFNTPS